MPIAGAGKALSSSAPPTAPGGSRATITGSKQAPQSAAPVTRKAVTTPRVSSVHDSRTRSLLAGATRLVMAADKAAQNAAVKCDSASVAMSGKLSGKLFKALVQSDAHPGSLRKVAQAGTLRVEARQAVGGVAAKHDGAGSAASGTGGHGDYSADGHGHGHDTKQQASGSLGTPRAHITVERCSRCTIDAVWTACDVFWEFDRNHSGGIQRREYMKCLAEPASVLRLRLLRRAKLEDRFRASARPVTLAEWLTLIWPQATPRDVALMNRWSQLREAWSIFNNNNFRGLESDLRRVFEFLDGNGEGKVRLSDLARAQILPAEEMRRIAKTHDLASMWMDLDTFRNQMWPELKTKFLRAETIARMKKEEEASMQSTFVTNLSALSPSRLAVAE